MIIRLNILTLAFILLASFLLVMRKRMTARLRFSTMSSSRRKKEKKEIPPAPEASKPVRARDNNTAALQKKLATQKGLIADKDKTIHQLQAQLKSQPPAVTPAPVDNSALNKTIAQLQGPDNRAGHGKTSGLSSKPAPSSRKKPRAQIISNALPTLCRRKR